LAEYKAASNLSNQSLLPLQELKKKIQAETSIPGIFYQGNQVVDAVEEAITLIESRQAASAPPLCKGDYKLPPLAKGD
jgi:hypothetical protein